MAVEMGDIYRDTRPLRDHCADTGVCILAAGLAKRLEPISDVIAKPAFPLAGHVPIVELWVRRFVDAGITKIAMNLHRVPETIRGYFMDGQRFLAEITYVYEETPTGTLGGAIKMIKAFQKDGFHPRRVFIPSGDIVSNVTLDHLRRMVEAHAANDAVASLMLAPIPWDRRGDFGTAVLDGVPAGQEVHPGTYAKILDFREKDPDSPSNENNASNYLVETSLLLELEQHLTPARPDIPNPCYDFGKHVFMGIKGKVPHLRFLERYKDRLFGFEPGTLWFDVGNKRDYLEVNKAALHKQIPINLPYTEYPWGWMGDHVEIDFSRVTIHPPVVIGHNCTIFPDTEIGPNVVLGDGWTCHRKARIKDAVLWRHHGSGGLVGELRPRTSRIREVREGVVVDTAIIVGGIITSDVRGVTVDVLPNGELKFQSLDWLPTSVRA
jgi:mannose-1-phosphate guanylyltransferase / phosphomannomutase